MTSALVATRDPLLLDELSRLVAAAGATLVVAARGAAPAVGVGDPGAGRCRPRRRGGRDGPPRRAHVYVVASGAAAETRVPAGTGARRRPGRRTARGSPPGCPGCWPTSARSASRPGRLVGVIGGSGGAGATTFACALGQVAARDGPSVVVDTDPFGPGVDRVLGLDGAPGVHWDDLGLTSGRLGARAFREALPHRDGLGVLTWSAGSTAALSPTTVREALSAAARGHDVVVVDLPRGADLARRGDGAALRPRGARRPATVSSVAATARLVGRLPAHGRVGLVTRGSGIDPDELAAVTGAPLLAAMTGQRGLTESVDLGLGPVRRAAARWPGPRATSSRR